MLRLLGDILTVNDDLALVNGENTGDGIKHSGFASAIATDYGSKITGL